MEKTGMIGVDLGKRSFQLRGVRGDGTAIFRKKVSRERFLAEVSERGPCVVAPQGIANVARLAAAVDDPETRLPETVRAPGRELLEQIGILDAKIGKLDAEVRRRAKESGEAKRLTAIPGIGPVCAMAVQAFAPPMEGFRRGRDFSAWLGLVPRQCSTGGKPKLGRISKMGQRDLRRLPVAGAIVVIR